jgi:endonuclease-3
MFRPRAGTSNHVREVVDRLAEAHGELPWRRRHDPVSELVTTILSHSTTDANQFAAFDELRRRFPSWEEVREAPAEEVMDAVRVAGMPSQKGPRVQRALEIVAEDGRGEDLEWLGQVPVGEAMEFLTSIPGVGPKTAACVLCFCFNRHVLPVDTHVHRIALRTHMVPPGTDAVSAQERLTRAVPDGQAYSCVKER